MKSNEIVLLLFDISNFDSFQWIVDRAHLIHQLKKIPPSVILIGTKYDLDWKRDVEAEDAYQLAEHFKWQYVEISAADQSIADHVSKTIFRFEPEFTDFLWRVRVNIPSKVVVLGRPGRT